MTLIRLYILTLRLRADAPFPSQLRWRRLRYLTRPTTAGLPLKTANRQP